MDVIRQFRNSAVWKEKARRLLEHPSKMLQVLKRLSLYTKKKGLSSVTDYVQTMYAYIKDIVEGRYKGYSKQHLLSVVAVVLYVVSPLDLIPDFIVSLGLLDDVTLIMWAVKELNEEFERYRKWRDG